MDCFVFPLARGFLIDNLGMLVEASISLCFRNVDMVVVLSFCSLRFNDLRRMYIKSIGNMARSNPLLTLSNFCIWIH